MHSDRHSWVTWVARKAWIGLLVSVPSSVGKLVWVAWQIDSQLLMMWRKHRSWQLSLVRAVLIQTRVALSGIQNSVESMGLVACVLLVKEHPRLVAPSLSMVAED